ncbi:MAG TPA: glycosyltransferase family 4 protein [Blastocatellia bacterium]|nr:glycosyltransferase family 4 protein [Blastocatellia bacterium]HMV83903.1 glycosyltransferase family 4 protein [Blastocatellia bacterium]HMY70565.1 glycosyltransferase family 4 protein [Blastocatellia bacterium]HMZ20230.1 glycosyltransferase family 4 protein [Blastocatellia bacterium]HNG28582.1 glycosyltransferase family 4 protein [Blastocatellia bacterium]
MNHVDIVHLTFKPPFTTGSFNRMVGTQLQQIRGVSQAAISFWDQPLPAGVAADEKVILIGGDKLSLQQRAWLAMPERWRGKRFNGVTGRQSLMYLWGVLEQLPRLRPRLVVCQDNYKFGALLRQRITWPCRLILWQHGLSYHLPTATASQLYSLKSFDQVCVLSRAAYQFDRPRMAAYEPVVQVMPNWVDVNRFRPATDAERRELRARWSLPQDKQIVLWLSRLVPKKGAHALLQSWPQVLRACPNAFLWIVGSGDDNYERYLKSLIAAMGVSDSVRLQGAVSPEDAHACCRAADVFAFTSLVSEGFSLALLEAMACGLASVASYQASIAETYPPESIALVRDANLANAFVKPLAELLNDLAGRREMGRQARQFVAENYNQEKVLAELATFYQQQMSLVGETQSTAQSPGGQF